MITTRGRYAVRVMIDLAEHDTGGVIPLKEIAARQEISKKYLEIIVKDLVVGGLIKGASGRGGGYKLCRKPEDYTIGEIVELMEGTLAVVSCLTPGSEPCPRAEKCRSLPLWEEYDRITRDFLYGKKLSDYVASGE